MILLLLLQACSDQQPAAHYVRTELDAWVHYGTEDERRMIQQQVTRFNELQDAVRINAVILPAGVYHEQIETAAANGRLPDILELDPAYIGYHAWHEHLRPIDKLLTDSIRIDLLPSLVYQNMVQGRLYAVSPNSRVRVLYGRRSILKQAGVAVPKAQLWSGATFVEWVEALAAHAVLSNDPAPVIELHAERDEPWLAEALLSLIYADDASLVDRASFVAKLDAPSTLQWLEQIQGWFMRGMIDNTAGDSFLTGQVSLALATQAEFESYNQAWKDDLLVLPLWGNSLWAGRSWGLSRNCQDTRMAMRFIEFLLQPEEILVMADASTTLPATRSALQMSTYFQTAATTVFDAPLLEQEQLSPLASPAYPQLRSRFYHLVKAIAGGEDVHKEVGRAMADMALIIEQYQEVSANARVLSTLHVKTQH